nr:hypothetical protein [Allomuricauda sp.]
MKKEGNYETSIDRLKAHLLNFLSWGEVDQWSTRNFRELSDLIFERTSIQLSISTLKRFLGKVAYQNNPSAATLDAIALYLGYQNFADFCQKNTEIRKKSKQRFINKRSLVFVFSILVLVGILSVLAFIGLPESEIDSSQVAFSIRRVDVGLPNTVVFQYDVSGINAEMVEIQQDWDPSKRHKVNPKKNVFTHYYKYPGYYKAKLRVNGKVVKERDLFIPTDGWMAVISDKRSSSPRYLHRHEFQADTILGITDTLKEEFIATEDGTVLDYYNALPDPKHSFRDFVFEADMKFDGSSGKTPCEFRKLILFGTKMFIRIPISVPGCVSKNNLKLGSLVVSGMENDLSAISTQSGVWSKVKVVNTSNQLSVYISNKQVYETTLSDDFGKLAGVRISFEGFGQVKNLQLSAEGQEVLSIP